MATTEGPAAHKPRAPLSPNASSVHRKAPSAPPTTYRRLKVDEQGQFAYKKTPASTLMASLQLGLQHSIGSIEPKPRRDILMTDFEVVDTVEFPSAGSDITPGHKYKDFTFKTYSPEAFRFFREAFGIPAEDFLVALCDRPLRELGNPGASGSLFFLSVDDSFIIKTVQKKEARFLQKLLPGYYLNLTQHKRTLLPKFFGLYRYKCGSTNIRIIVMNNLLPSTLRYHEKYDLKGSTYKRRAGPREVEKASPTFKDLDFGERHEGNPECRKILQQPNANYVTSDATPNQHYQSYLQGILLVAEKYDVLMKSVERDCNVLESFGIMDYSLLLGVHNIDHAQQEMAEAEGHREAGVGQPAATGASREMPVRSRIELSKNFSIISVEDIPLVLEEQTQEHPLYYPEGYIQGHLPSGEHVLLYLGIIDILQSYRLKKKLEHSLKSIMTDGTTVSVHNPSYYSRRFMDFVGNQVFKREKVRFRTRKNSTSVQMKGRKQGSTRIPRGPGGFQRQGSKELKDIPESQSSPRHVSASSPPTSIGVVSPLSIPQPVLKKEIGTYRQNAVDEYIATSRDPNLPEIPTLEVCRPTQEQYEEAVEQDKSLQPEEGPVSLAMQAATVSDAPRIPTYTLTHQEGNTLGAIEEEGVDFANHVRETSTPINGDSPDVGANRSVFAVTSSQTFELTASTQANDVSDTISTEQIKAEVRIMADNVGASGTEKYQSSSREDSETAF